LGRCGGRAQSSGKALLTAEWHHLAILDYEIEPAAATSDPVTTHQPVVVTKVINMLKNPDFNVRELSRVIADDPSLASKTLSMSRSPRYAQRFQPKTVHEAILVLGLQTLRNIVVTAAAASFL
jgi:HD-like signal output (HDOD) protein